MNTYTYNRMTTSTTTPIPAHQGVDGCNQHISWSSKCEECHKRREKTLQRTAVKGLSREIPLIVADVLLSPSQPLDTHTRSFMESRFGHDFSHVHVHTNAPAAASARAVNAHAYTVGHDIVFGAGQYVPETSAGQQLLAHELTHVVQQNGLGMGSFSSLRVGPIDNPLERQAAASARDVGGAVALSQSTGSLLQRAPIDPSERPIQPHGGTVPYREATELSDCIRVLGEGSAAYCRQLVLGEPVPPRPTQHQLPGITTPLPINVELNPDSTASLQVNQINVVFDPDAHSSDPTKAGHADTNFNLSAFGIHYQATNGRVTSFTGPGPVQVRIQTTYGPGVAPGSASGYGRGTTTSDLATGNISLSFHEGQHGLDFLEFMHAHPFPRFIGRRGMSVQQFEAAMQSFRVARDRYSQEMNRFSEERTDCVGRTKDQANAANGIRTTICRQVVPRRL
ncbi:MAG: DUF4157 domain-containing protein [Herpetosiphonaceae bacterium]|nr:DUF4157 domain-containing protein [Herpetosiphonaceae bacterium]